MTQQGWVPIALSQMIEPGTSAGTLVDGAEIVVWRDSSAVAHAWEDRCPHRGMKMSFGFVRGDHIACLYHGWEYDESGTCRYIPAHPDLEVPKSICISRYAVADTGDMIWAHVPLGSTPEAAPEMTAMAGLRSVYFKAPLAEVLGHLKEAKIDGAIAQYDIEGIPAVIGLQSISPSQSALHVTLPEGTSSELRLSVLDWCESLRLKIETAEVAA
nr:Rieske (2Fe-2S) protein [uncultured Celeribacter sp.]